MAFQHHVKIAFLDVGQGDSIVVTVPDTGEAVIIDCPEAGVVFDYLRGEQIRFIRALIITHLHSDHYREGVEFLENCVSQLGIECERLVFNWQNNNKLLTPDTDEHSEYDVPPAQRRLRERTIYEDLIRWSNEHEEKGLCVSLIRPRKDEFLEIDGTIVHAIKILQPSYGQVGKLSSLSLNNISAILRIEGPNSSALLTADIEPKGWEVLQKSSRNVRSDVLKFPHHGAWKDADPHNLLEHVDPSIVVISVGTEGIKYGHPNEAVLKAIYNRTNTLLFCTQVTQRCTLNPQAHKVAIQDILETDAASRKQQNVRTARGCPCAGTVIIELGDIVRVLQPDSTLHYSKIIQPFFTSHQCAR